MDSAMFHAGQQAGYGVPRSGFKRQWRASSDQNRRSRKRNKTAQHQQQRNAGAVAAIVAGMYDPPRLMELQRQNRIRTRRHFPKRRKSSVPRVPPRAPFNDSSYLMRVRQSGGLASSASPVTPATPAFVSTPVFASPSPQLEGDVRDYGYGSMEGLIHLKLCPDETGSRVHDDVQAPQAQSVQQVEEQLDHDVSRFEMTLPSGNGLSHRTQLMEVRLAEQESHIAYLEDENLTLKERLFLAQQEANELRHRLQRGCLPSQREELICEDDLMIRGQRMTEGVESRGGSCTDFHDGVVSKAPFEASALNSQEFIGDAAYED